MDNDFDTPTALSELVLASKEIAKARAQDNVSGDVLQKQAAKVREKFEILGVKIGREGEGPSVGAAIHCGMDEEQINKLIEQREEARKNKDFKKSDEIRDRLAKNGIVLEDSKNGARWRYSQNKPL
jgi:cysteinyl-tRNA synthetase